MFLNRKWLLFIAIVVLSISFTVFVIQSEITYRQTPFNDRKDLKEVVFSHTSCAETWRTYLMEMLHDPEFDYENNQVYQKCKKELESIK